jgi:hypothetical protein
MSTPTVSQEVVDEVNARVNAAIGGRIADYLNRRDGTARQTHSICEDGSVVTYTTSRVEGGPHDGKFLAMLYRPRGKGARSGNASEHVRTYIRAFSTRKAAKARAIELYAKWAARHGRVTA